MNKLFTFQHAALLQSELKQPYGWTFQTIPSYKLFTAKMPELFSRICSFVDLRGIELKVNRTRISKQPRGIKQIAIFLRAA